MYKAGIIGCGSIGALKPLEFDGPDTKNVLTHAHAIYNSKRIQLIAVVDTDAVKLKESANRWQCTPYYSHQKMMDNHKLDLIIVATPTETHLQVLSEIALHKNRPKIVIGEKPLTMSSTQCRSVKDLYNELRIPLVVNYTRRWNGGFQILKEKINDEIFGKVMSCSIAYTRGLLRDGCHAIDFLNWFFGHCLKAVKLSPNIADGFNTCSVFLAYENCPYCFLIHVDWKYYNVFEIDIFCECARFRLTSGGAIIHEYAIETENTYGAYPQISEHALRTHTSLAKTLPWMVDNVIDHMEGALTNLRCDVSDALAVHQVIDKIERK